MKTKWTPIIFLLVLDIIVITGCSQTTTKTITTVITPTTTTSVQSENGLQLRVSVNATSLTSGEELQINASEYNTLATTNDISAAPNWGINGLATGACPNISDLPFGVALFQGRYAAQNISKAAPLNIYVRRVHKV
jgi:hypothetical protein